MDVYKVAPLTRSVQQTLPIGIGVGSVSVGIGVGISLGFIVGSRRSREQDRM